MRATDQLRERTVTELGAGYAAGMLGFDTLCGRVDSAYGARSVEQLRALVADLPASTGSVARRLGSWFASLVPHGDPRLAREPALLTPPVSERGRLYLLGRDPGSDLWIEDETVSRRHAALRSGADGWTLEDLGSFNGTYVNDWRIDDPVQINPGDAIRLADVAWVFAPRAG